MNLPNRTRFAITLFIIFIIQSFNVSAQYVVSTIEPESTIGNYVNVSTVNADLAVLPNGNTLKAIVWDSYNGDGHFSYLYVNNGVRDMIITLPYDAQQPDVAIGNDSVDYSISVVYNDKKLTSSQIKYISYRVNPVSFSTVTTANFALSNINPAGPLTARIDLFNEYPNRLNTRKRYAVAYEDNGSIITKCAPISNPTMFFRVKNVGVGVNPDVSARMHQGTGFLTDHIIVGTVWDGPNGVSGSFDDLRLPFFSSGVFTAIAVPGTIVKPKYGATSIFSTGPSNVPATIVASSNNSPTTRQLSLDISSPSFSDFTSSMFALNDNNSYCIARGLGTHGNPTYLNNLYYTIAWHAVGTSNIYARWFRDDNLGSTMIYAEDSGFRQINNLPITPLANNEVPMDISSSDNSGRDIIAAWYDGVDVKYKFISSNNQQFKTTTINTLSEEKQFSIYPNPAKKTFKLSTVKSFNKADIDIMDMTGKVVQKSQASTVINGNYIEVPLNNLTPGNYIVNICTNTGKYTQKLTIE